MDAVTVAGAILIGGDSVRMGRDKASHPWGDSTLLHHVHRIVAPLCGEMMIVTRPGREVDAPEGCRVIRDRLEGRGPLVGIHAALEAAAADRVLVVACDMPWLSPALLSAMIENGHGDVVVPRTANGWEPLHAIYGRRCLPPIEAALAGGPSRVPGFFGEVEVDVWDERRCREYDPELRSFENVNRPRDIPEVD